MSVPEPSKITTPWANAGLKNAIPAAADPVTGKAGFDLGFAAINMTAKEAGGIPPFGQDFNGILFSITEVLRYMQAGGRPTFSAELSAAIGGYPKSALVLGDDGITAYRNTIASNTSNPNAGGAGWVNEDTAPTPPLFDSDTSIATTEFVQRALGNLHGNVGITSAQALVAADVGKMINLTGTGYTVTLPSAATVADGATLWFKHLGSPSPSTVTLAAFGGESIRVNDATVPTFTLNATDSIMFYQRGGEWRVGAGSAELKSSALFDAFIGTNGSQRLPSGLLIQWGSGSTSSSADITITYPIAFAQRFSLTGQVREGGTVSRSLKLSSATAPGTASTNFTASIVDAAGNRNALGFEWQAIGI